MFPEILAVIFSREQTILLCVMVGVMSAGMVPFYKWLERCFGRLTFKARKRICRIGQRIFGTILVSGVIGCVLSLGCGPYMLLETSDDNMSYCLAVLNVMSFLMSLVGVVGWGLFVCLDFMPARQKGL